MYAVVEQLLPNQCIGVQIDENQLHGLGQDHEDVLLVAALDVVDVRTMAQRHLLYAEHRAEIEEVDLNVLFVLRLMRIVDRREHFGFLHDGEETLVQAEPVEAQRDGIVLALVVEMPEDST